MRPCQEAGQPRWRQLHRGKSGLHEARVAGNARPVTLSGEAEGKCHREYTADGA